MKEEEKKEGGIRKIRKERRYSEITTQDSLLNDCHSKKAARLRCEHNGGAARGGDDIPNAVVGQFTLGESEAERRKATLAWRSEGQRKLLPRCTVASVTKVTSL